MRINFDVQRLFFRPSVQELYIELDLIEQQSYVPIGIGLTSEHYWR